MTRSLFSAAMCATAVVWAANGAFAADASSGSGAVSIVNGNPVVQDFNTLSGTTTPSNTLPTGWYLTESGTGSAADGSYVVGNGSGTAGGAYSFGATGSSDRALGSLGSGSVTPILYGAKITNNAQGPITTLAISYAGEMWRRGTSASDGLTFAYSTTAGALNAASGFISVPALNFNSPGSACSSTQNATDGNSAACRTIISGTITGLLLNPGASIWIRWTDVDNSGSDGGMAIDDVAINAIISSDPTPPSASGLATPNPVAPGGAINISGTIIPGFNPLSQTLAVSCDLTAVGGSANQALPVSGSGFTYGTSIGAGTPVGIYSLPCSVSDDQNRSSHFAIALTVLLPLNSTCGALATPVHSIQGSGPVSPLVGFTVDVEAVVVGNFQGSNRLSGFYVEAPVGDQDGNPATSEGMFIYSAVPVNVGDRVRIRGNVAEYASSTGSLTSRLTELSGVSSVQVCSSGQPLPAAVSVSLPVGNVADWERYEGMLVHIDQRLVVTGNYDLGDHGQVDLAPAVMYQPTQTPGNGVSWATAADLIGRSVIALDDGSTSSGQGLNGGTVAPYPAPGLSNSNTLRAGALVNPGSDTSPNPLLGILDDRYGAYRIQPTSAVTFSNSPNPRPDTAAVAARVGGRFKIAGANVFNFFTTLGSRGASTATELNNQRTKIVAELSKTGADVIGITELQNFVNGQAGGGTYTNSAIGDLTAALAAATGRNYQFIDTIDPSALVTGNSVADNGTDAIRSGIIYNASTVTPVGRAALYNQNDQNRPTLAQTFQPAGGPLAASQTFTVVVNHFRSRGSACAAGNDPFQGNCNGMRLDMANQVRNWLAGNPTSDPAGPDRKYVLVGDYNAYFGEDPIQTFLGSGGFTDLNQFLVGPTAYSYNFDSQAGYIDHGLVNSAALPLVKGFALLHINADEPAALSALDSGSKSAAAQAAYYAPNEFAAADHDPLLIGFNPLRGDFNDDGQLSEDDRDALLRARGQSGTGMADRRMDLDGDGAITQADFLIWQKLFIDFIHQSKPDKP